MINKGLKKGAIFEDGGLFYMVIHVCDDGNYVSRHISAQKKEEIETKRRTEAKETTKKATRTKGA